jgi:hypothetical protein
MREKKLTKIEAMAETIRPVAVPGMRPEGLIEAVKERHLKVLPSRRTAKR